MKAISIIKYRWQFIAALFMFTSGLRAQDSTGGDMNISLRYFSYNNKIPYVLVNTKTKVEGKWQPVKNIGVSVFLDSITPLNLVGKVNTDENGNAQLIVPAALKPVWDASPGHKFLAESDQNKQFAAATSDIEIIKAKITVDTTIVDNAKSITVKVLESKGDNWVPVKDVEVKIGIQRMNSVLPVGKEATYTTDSTGEVTAEFKRDSLPADKGLLTLVVNVEDNDKYGNLILEQSLPWGVNLQKADDWNRRTLFSTRFRTPIWLLFMAYSIMAAVWGVLIYLLIQIARIRKLGKAMPLQVQ